MEDQEYRRSSLFSLFSQGGNSKKSENRKSRKSNARGSGNLISVLPPAVAFAAQTQGRGFAFLFKINHIFYIYDIYKYYLNNIYIIYIYYIIF